MEAEAALSLLPALDQDPIRYQIAQNIKTLLHQQHQRHFYTTSRSSHEKKILNQLK
jgi:hypothetical protein